MLPTPSAPETGLATAAGAAAAASTGAEAARRTVSGRRIFMLWGFWARLLGCSPSAPLVSWLWAEAGALAAIARARAKEAATGARATLVLKDVMVSSPDWGCLF